VERPILERPATECRETSAALVLGDVIAAGREDSTAPLPPEFSLSLTSKLVDSVPPHEITVSCQ
jgi:hypothetical protein